MWGRGAGERAFGGLLCLVAWLAVSLQIYLALRVVTANGQSWITGIIHTLSYFTVLTNLLVAIVLTISLIQGHGGRFFSKPSTLTATALYIFVVGMIYALLLRGIWEPTGLSRVADEALHVVVPIGFLAYWLLFVPKGSLSWKQPVQWLLYPFVYYVYFLTYGATTGRYLYPFGDINALGYRGVAINSVLFLIGFFGLGLIFVAIDHALGGKGRGGEASTSERALR